MKTYDQINKKIESGKAVVLTAEEIIDYVDKNGLDKAAREVDVVTTATFGPMCSSGCFLNFGHTVPKIRMTEAWLDDVPLYCGIAAVDAFLGATQLRYNDSANMDYPGKFDFGGAHVMEKLVAGEKVQLFGLSYGTDDYPRREVRTYLTINDINQAIMTNPRNCYQNYNAAINCSDKPVYTYFGMLKPNMKNVVYCSAGQLSPLLNDPYYRTIGIGTRVWLAGAQGHVYAEGTQHEPSGNRNEYGIPTGGAGTLAVTGHMKNMKKNYVRGISLKGYGVSLALGVGIPVPVLDQDMLKRLIIRDDQITAPVTDYSHDYPMKTGKVLANPTYAELKRGEVIINGMTVESSSISSYQMALEIAEELKAEVTHGDFLLSKPISSLSTTRAMNSMPIQEQ